MATARQIIKQWFSNFKKPTQEQFWAWIDSFWHKDDKIPMSSVQHLEQSLQNVVTSDQFGNHLADDQAHAALLAQKVDKQDGKGLISDSEKADIQNNKNKRVIDFTITGDVNKIFTLIYNDGTTQQKPFTDIVGETAPDVMLNSLNFNTETGVLTGIRSDGQQLTVDLNGRFALLNHTHSYNDLTNKPTLFSGDYNDLTNKPNFAVTQDITRALAVHLAGISNNSMSYSVDGKDAGKTIFLNNQSNVLIEDFEGFTACFKKCYDGATGTSFYSPNYQMVHNGGTQLDGKKGSNAVVSVNNGICYVDYCNY